MKYMTMMALALLVSCGGGGGSSDTTPTPPAPPPTTTPTPPPNNNPAEGTRLRTRCEGTTKVIFYADGNGGETRDTTSNAPECGYFEATMVDSKGDRFDPVVITYEPADAPVTAELDESVADWARITVGDGRIEIYGNRVNYSTSVVVSTPGKGEVFRFSMLPEPKCDTSLTGGTYKIDCMGHEMGGRAAALIYYGEDDTRVVDVEVGFVRSTSRYPDAEPGTRVPDDHPIRQEIEAFLEYANEFNQRSKVYINFVLSDVVWEAPWESIYDFGGGSPELRATSDLIYGWGAAGGNGGEAFLPASIYPSMSAIRTVGTNIGSTALHEIGHAMGLGHGVWGNPDWELETTDPSVMTGSIFPRFGHGWTATRPDNVCGAGGSVMTYAATVDFWTNSLLSCSEMGESGGRWGDAAGSRRHTDEAYAINRVRYSLSLIHDEYAPDEEVVVTPSATSPPVDSTPTPTPTPTGDTCPRTGTLQTGLIDCQGYPVTTSYPEEGYTYYGEDDTTVVTWEVALLVFDNDCAPIVNGQKQAGICDRALTNFEMDRAEETIATMQGWFDQSRIYVNLDLKYVRLAHFTSLGNIPQTDFNVDAVLAFGGPSPADASGGVICGYGGFDGNFINPLRPWGICGVKDLAHELGHTIGLSHGPFQTLYPGTGALFPSFGHGGGSSICGGYGSIMSYNTGFQSMWSNSLYACNELVPISVTNPGGSRGTDGYDEAYVFNRVRYNVANINGE